jgi:hypothetical protein
MLYSVSPSLVLQLESIMTPEYLASTLTIRAAQLPIHGHKICLGCAMAQADSCQAVTAEARILARSVHVGFVVDRVALEQAFLRFLRVFPSVSTGAPDLYIICGMNNRPIGCHSSETLSDPSDMNN